MIEELLCQHEFEEWRPARSMRCINCNLIIDVEDAAKIIVQQQTTIRELREALDYPGIHLKPPKGRLWKDEG